MSEFFTVSCPSCGGCVVVYHTEKNCRVFRHGVYKDTFVQINPHLSKEECDRLVNKKKIIGCGRPFRIVFVKDNWVAELCDYI